MISKREDYSYLLDITITDICSNYYLKDGEVIDDYDNEPVSDKRIINIAKFFSYYCMAYEKFENKKENNQSLPDSTLVIRALGSYGIFNSLINNCLGEYRVYGDIGTGNVSYVPYQTIADFFFQNEETKNVLLGFIRSEIIDKKEEKLKMM